MLTDNNYDFQSIGDGLFWLIEMIGDFFEDLAQVGVVVGDVALLVPTWLSSFPVAYVSILGFGLGVAVMFKIVGR